LVYSILFLHIQNFGKSSLFLKKWFSQSTLGRNCYCFEVKTKKDEPFGSAFQYVLCFYPAVDVLGLLPELAGLF